MLLNIGMILIHARGYLMYRIVLATMACFVCYSVGWAQLPSALHDYELNNSLADSLGGPSLVNNGATLGATGLTFAPNQGPSLSNWLGGSATSGNYSIEMYFSLTDTNGYRKLIDYQNRTADAGLYNLNTSLDFYPAASGSSGAIPANTMTHLVFTRDGGSNQVVGYINGSTALGMSFTDSSNLAVFSAANNIMQFFQDDAVTSFNEASGGFVDFIRIYDHSLTAQDAQNLFGAISAVPEPSTMIMLAVGAAGAGMVTYKKLGWKRRQRRNQGATRAVTVA